MIGTHAPSLEGLVSSPFNGLVVYCDWFFIWDDFVRLRLSELLILSLAEFSEVEPLLSGHLLNDLSLLSGQLS